MHWTPESAIKAAHAAGFAGTCWTIGPEELAVVLNRALCSPPQVGIKEVAADTDTLRKALLAWEDAERNGGHYEHAAALRDAALRP